MNFLLFPVLICISFPGLSSRDLILHFKHKAVLLFKLFLLERKVGLLAISDQEKINIFSLAYAYFACSRYSSTRLP